MILNLELVPTHSRIKFNHSKCKPRSLSYTVRLLRAIQSSLLHLAQQEIQLSASTNMAKFKTQKTVSLHKHQCSSLRAHLFQSIRIKWHKIGSMILKITTIRPRKFKGSRHLLFSRRTNPRKLYNWSQFFIPTKPTWILKLKNLHRVSFSMLSSIQHKSLISGQTWAKRFRMITNCHMLAVQQMPATRQSHRFSLLSHRWPATQMATQTWLKRISVLLVAGQLYTKSARIGRLRPIGT